MAQFTSMPMDGLGRDQSHLICPHCNEIAAWADSETDQFTGEDEACDNCGFPGHVAGLELPGDLADPRWEASTSPSATCDCDDCPKCGMWRGERF